MTRRRSFLVRRYSQSNLKNNRSRGLDNGDLQSRKLRTLLRGHTRILITATMSARSAQARYSASRKSGRVTHAGPCSTCHASRSGRRTKVQQQRSSKRKVTTLRLDSGGVLVATCRRLSYRRLTNVGAGRRWSQEHLLVSRRTHVDRLAARSGLGSVHTLAS